MAHNPNGNLTHALLNARAATTPDAIALSHVKHGDLSYAQLQEHVFRRANVLTEVGVGSGTRVACLTYDHLATVESYLAIAQVGGVVVAANPLWEDEVLATLLERARCELFVYDAACQEQVDRIADRLPTVRTWLRIGGGTETAVDLDARAALAPTTAPPIGGAWDDPVLLSFTSGTTGLPKAVAHTHASCLETARLWTDVPLGEAPVLYSGPLVSGIVFTSTVAPSLWGGVRIVLEEDAGFPQFIHSVEKYKVTHFSNIVSYFTGALRAAPPEAELSSLRVVLLGGEPVTRSALDLIYGALPEVRVYSFYGQSEAPYSCITEKPLARAEEPGITVQTGYAVKVVDANGERLIDRVGEIWLGGPHLMSGYDAQPEKTAEVLKDGWYIGGDLGLCDAAGRLTILGRREDAIVKDGTYVLPIDVEEYAVGLAAVSEAGATPVGESGERKLLLAVVLQAGAAETADSIREAVAAVAPATHVPDTVVVVEELPYSTNMAGRGKLLRREIAQRWGSLVGA